MAITAGSINGEESRQLRDQPVYFVSQRDQRFERSIVNSASDGAVKKLVISVRQDCQVLRAIIKLISVFVMNMFARCERASNRLFHYQPMFSNALSFDGVRPIAAPQRYGSIGPSPVDRVKYDSWIVRVPRHTNAVHIAQRPHTSVPSASLSKWFPAVWDFAKLRILSSSARAIDFRISSHCFGILKSAPFFQAPRMHRAIPTGCVIGAVRGDAQLCILRPDSLGHMYVSNVKAA